MAKHGEPEVRPELRETCGHSPFGTAAGAVLLLALLCALADAYVTGRDGPGVDFYQYWAVTDAVSRGAADDVYSPQAARRLGEEFRAEAEQSSSPRLRQTAEFRRVLEIYQTPLLHAVFSPLAGRGFEDALRVHAALSVACLGFAVAVLGRVAGLSPLATMAAVAALAGWFGPVRSDLRVGNVNQILLALLALFLWLRSEPAGRAVRVVPGVVLGLAVMFKPTLAYVVLVLEISWLANRRRAALLYENAGILAGAAAGFAIGAAFHGSVSCWAAWLTALRNMPGSIITLQMGNVGLSRLLAESLGVDLSGPLAALFVALCAGFLWAARARAAAPDEAAGGRDPAQEDLTAVALGCLVCVLSARLAWFHYYVLTIPAALALLRPRGDEGPAGARRAAARRLLFVVAVLCVAMEPWLDLVSFDAPTIVAITDGGALALFGSLLRGLWLERGAACPAAGGVAKEDGWIPRS